MGGEIHVSQTIKWNQSRPTCVALKDGRFVIAWIGEASHGTTQAGTPYIIINRDETDHDDLPQVSLRLSGNVEEIFPPAVDETLNSS